MVVLNSNDTSGIQLFHKFVRGESPTPPNYYEFGSITDTGSINDSLTSVGSEFIRKYVTWAATGSNSLYNVSLNTAECNGSTINVEGLVAGATINTGSLYTVDESVIFNKDSTFFVTVEGEFIVNN